MKHIIRCDRAGVHYGTLVSVNGQTVVLANARRLWFWSGANTLNEVATEGVNRRSKMSTPVVEITLLDAIEVIACTEEAEASLDAARWGV